MESVEIVFSDIIWSFNGSVVVVVYNLQQLCEAFKVGIPYSLMIRYAFFSTVRSLYRSDNDVLYMHFCIVYHFLAFWDEYSISSVLVVS